MQTYFLLSESSIEAILSDKHGRDSKYPPNVAHGVRSKDLPNGILGFATGRERGDEYLALIDIGSLSSLSGDLETVYTRIVRVLKSANKPPVHLPRGWSEFHYKNRLTFFAASERIGSQRWLADIDSSSRIVRFLGVTDPKSRIGLENWEPPSAVDISDYHKWAATVTQTAEEKARAHSFSDEVDLKAIGSGAVVQGYPYEHWLKLLKPEQKTILGSPLESSIRVIGPAGSGKTLTLCMRAIKLSRDEVVIGGRRRILVVTHSWAMAERIDGMLTTLNGGQPPDNVTVLPLLFILQDSAGSIGHAANAVLGEDSAEGQRRVIEMLDRFLEDTNVRLGKSARDAMSGHVTKALGAKPGSHLRNELVLDVYDEVIGILSPQGIFPGDSDKVAEYLTADRDQTMPPFPKRADRELCLSIFDLLMDQLVDLGAITTDQLVLDSVRVLETFTWNVRRETDGYDYILIDELQLFDAQERLAISLLSRAKPGMVFLSVEDPSQGLYSRVNERTQALKAIDQKVLKETHRFRAGLFEFISYLYSKFPLNVTAIKVAKSDTKVRKPRLIQAPDSATAIRYCVEKSVEIAQLKEKDRRVCFVCVSGSEDDIYDAIHGSGISVVRLRSYDDVDMLSYQRRAAVVSSWQFVGGTQFSDVVLVVLGVTRTVNFYSRLRQLTAIYLGASRASSALDILCDAYVPDVLREAARSKLLTKVQLR